MAKLGSRHKLGQAVGELGSSCEFGQTAASDEVFSNGAELDGMGNPHDPYRHNKVMREMRRLRLKRVVARDEEDRLSARGDNGQWVSRLMVHIGSRSCSSEVGDQHVGSDQLVPKKTLKSVQKATSGSSKKKKVSFGPLEESFIHLDRCISCITDEILVELQAKYHILASVKLRAPTADERPHHVHRGEVAIYLEAIHVELRFLVHLFFRRVLHSLHVTPI